MKINNRRYIGSKKRLLAEIGESVLPLLHEKDYASLTFVDLFAGTGVVAEYFAKKGFQVIINDLLYSNYVAYRCWLSDQNISREKIEKYIDFYNNIDYNDIKDNYFSEIYGDKYFSVNDAKRIGFIRDHIEIIRHTLTEREYYMLISILMYTADKIANTVGHFEHYLSQKPIDSNFKLFYPDISNYKNVSATNMDANILVKSIKCDIAYIDPPYNARQYINFYHVLENLARWDKPNQFEGKSMKFKRDNLKSGYSRSTALQLFKNLIQELDCRFLIVSYNNTYNAKSSASNNKINEEDLVSVLRKRGEVTKKEISHTFFNSGKTNFKDHKEFIFVCEVN